MSLYHKSAGAAGEKTGGKGWTEIVPLLEDGRVAELVLRLDVLDVLLKQ